MLIFPAIDLFGGAAVRLLRGEYDKMTVYEKDPLKLVRDFEAKGASCLHLVDLEGARSGNTDNLETVRRLAGGTSLFTEIGGGIRTPETVARYLDAGADRVILGTAAVTDEDFLCAMVAQYGEKIAVGADLKDGNVAIRGWTERTEITAEAFFEKLRRIGVKTVICTDISKDGAMQGTNHALYESLAKLPDLDIIASGGVSSVEDVRRLKSAGVAGAIIGKAYYTGAIDLREAIGAAV